MHIARMLLIGSGAILLTIAVGLFFQLPWAAARWPFPAGPLSFTFMAAILAGSAAPLLWIGLTGEIAALAGYGLGFGVMYAGIAGYAFRSWRLLISAPCWALV